MVKTACRIGDRGVVPGSGRPSGEANGSPLRCTCLANPVDRGAVRVPVQGAAKELDMAVSGEQQLK